MNTTTSTEFKTIISKFNGVCRNCETPFQAGDEIKWKPGCAVHPACEASMPTETEFKAQPQPKVKNLPRIPDGTYTVVFNDGTHQTIKFEIPKKGVFEGRRIASFLSGPDNETHFKGFAFIKDNNELVCWNSFQHYRVKDTVMQAVRVLYRAVKENGDEAFMQAGEEYALRSGKCSKCGRKLTVPASIHRGIGPECAKKVW